MTDYGKIHRGVPYFGIWASETADDYGKRDAVNVLTGAVEMCMDEDMRENHEVRSALAYLKKEGHDKRARAFLKALDVQHPVERRQAAAAAFRAIIDNIGPAFSDLHQRF